MTDMMQPGEQMCGDEAPGADEAPGVDRHRAAATCAAS